MSYKRDGVSFWGITFDVRYEREAADPGTGQDENIVINCLLFEGRDFVDFMSSAVIDGIIAKIQEGQVCQL